MPNDLEVQVNPDHDVPRPDPGNAPPEAWSEPIAADELDRLRERLAAVRRQTLPPLDPDRDEF